MSTVGEALELQPENLDDVDLLGWFVPAGADVVFGLATDDDPHRALLGYPGGVWRYRHRCDRTNSRNAGVVVCAPLLQAGVTGHVVLVRPDGPTVSPSILCADCGSHGFVRDGRWDAA